MKKLIILIILMSLCFVLWSADSTRTRTALETLFADQQTGAISAQDLRDFLASVFIQTDDDTLDILGEYLDSTGINYLNSLFDTGVTNTEYDYLDGVTSNIQTQFNEVPDSSYVDFTVTDSLYVGGEIVFKGRIKADVGMFNLVATTGYVFYVGETVYAMINSNGIATSGSVEADNAYFFGGTDSFRVVNGTASLNVAPGAAVDIDNNLTVTGNAIIDQDLTTDASVTFERVTIDSVLILTPIDTADVTTPSEGMIIWDDSDNKPYGYNGTTWNAFW